MTHEHLPAELIQLIASPSRDSRLEAVGELARLAEGADAASAAAARAALQELTGDDSRSLAASAAEALERSSIRLQPARLDFGRVPPGTPRLVADVDVLGPALARSATVSVSGPQLRATLTGSSLRVSWLPGFGSFSGTVTLNGPAGTATLVITGEAAVGPLSAAAAQARRRAMQGVGGLRAPNLADLAVPDRRRRWAVPLAAAAVLALLAGVGVGAAVTRQADSTKLTAPSAAPRAGTGPRLIITVQKVPISVDRPRRSATIHVGREPEGLAVSPDGRTVYVANQGEHILAVVDAASGAVKRIPLLHTARFVAVSNDGRRVYVSTYEDDLSGSTVAVIDAVQRRVLKYLVTGKQPYHLAVAPDGRLWVPIHSGHRVEIFSAGVERFVGRVTVPKDPHAVAFAADEYWAFTPNHNSNSVSVIDMRTDFRIGSIPVSKSPHSLAVTPDGQTIVVAAFDADAVNLIDGTTLRRRGPFPVGRHPRSVAISADSAHAYVVNESDNTVSVIDTSTGAVTGTVRVGGSPRSVAVAPDGRHAYVTNGADDTITVLDIAR